MVDKAKNRMMRSLPLMIRQVLPEGITYDDNVDRFRKENGQFTSTAEAQKSIITRESASKLSDGLTELVYQFNRMLAYTSNMEAAKDAEFEAVRDASREAEIEAADATPVQTNASIGLGDLISSVASALSWTRDNLPGLIHKVLQTALVGTGALALLSALLSGKDKDASKASQEDQTVAQPAVKPGGPGRGTTPSQKSIGTGVAEQADADKEKAPALSSDYEAVTTGGYGKATVTKEQLVGAPNLSSLDDLFSGGQATPINTRQGAHQSDSVRIRPVHPVTKKKNVPHAGTDIAAGFGTPINAIAPGKVIRAGRASGYGNIVDILHGVLNGQSVVTRYAHLSAITTTVNAMVGRGQKIGEMGSTGLSTASHLHFELIINGTYVKPTQQQIDFVISRAIGDAEPEAAPAWTGGDTAAVTPPKLPGQAAERLAQVDIPVDLVPPLDEKGIPTVDRASAGTRLTYNSRAQIPLQTISRSMSNDNQGTVDPRAGYIERLGSTIMAMG